MKNKFFLATIAFLFCSFFVNAQIKQGSVLLGGQVSYANSNYSNISEPTPERQTSNVMISLGKAFKENTVYGLNLSYSHYYESYYSGGAINSNQNSDGYAAAVFMRKYKTLGKNFYLFGESEAGYSWSKGTTKNNTNSPDPNVTTSKTSGVHVSFSPGISYQLLKKMQVEITMPDIASLYYTTNSSNGSTAKQNNLVFNTSLNSFSLANLGVGFRFVF